MLEAAIEVAINGYAKSRGVEVYKFTSPNRSAVPDRMYLFPNGTVLFLEFKRTGERATVPQAREHARIRGQHIPVYVVDNIDDGKRIIDHFRDHDARLKPDTSWWL